MAGATRERAGRPQAPPVAGAGCGGEPHGMQLTCPYVQLMSGQGADVASRRDKALTAAA